MKRALLTAMAVGMLLPGVAEAKVYQVDSAHSSIAFTVRHFVSYVEGRFKEFTGSIDYDAANPGASSVNFTVQTASINTDNDKRDDHLRGSDFFDVGKFAQARYRAEGFRKLDDGRYAADGTLELRGVRKPVTLTFSWTPGAAPVLQGKATVKRLDFGVGGGDWADTKTIPDETAISTIVKFDAK